MTGVPRQDRENKLIYGRVVTVRQKKRGQATERNIAINDEVSKLVTAEITREVHYHDWLSNPVMVKKSDNSWRMCVDFKDLNKDVTMAVTSAGKIIDWEVDSFVWIPLKCFLWTSIQAGYHKINGRGGWGKRQWLVLARFHCGKAEEEEQDGLQEEEERFLTRWTLSREGSSCVDGFASRSDNHDITAEEWSHDAYKWNVRLCQCTGQCLRKPQEILNPFHILRGHFTNGVIEISGPLPERGLDKSKIFNSRLWINYQWIEAKPVATITGSQESGEGIKARLGKENKNWLEEISHVLWAHRTMIKSSNGDTPFSLTYGTEAVIPAEIGMPTFRTTELDIAENDEALEINLDLIEEKREQAAIRESTKMRQMEKNTTTPKLEIQASSQET
ncbi:reverse transcriptase domain-containing protein [Tanacetum coccineum]